MRYPAWKRPRRHRHRAAAVSWAGGKCGGSRRDRVDRRLKLAGYYMAGLLLLAAGWVFWTAHDDLLLAQRVASQTISTAAEVGQVPNGQPVVVVGRIDPQTAFADERRRLTMYIDWQRLPKSTWVESHRVAPPFELDLTDAPLRVANEGYALRNLSEEAPAPGGTTRRGLRRGDTVVVVGTAAGGGVAANTVVGGSPTTYSSALRNEGLILLLVGLGMLALGVVAGGLGAGRWRRQWGARDRGRVHPMGSVQGARITGRPGAK